jgi:hypothetical protein
LLIPPIGQKLPEEVRSHLLSLRYKMFNNENSSFYPWDRPFGVLP